MLFFKKKVPSLGKLPKIRQVSVCHRMRGDSVLVEFEEQYDLPGRGCIVNAFQPSVYFSVPCGYGMEYVKKFLDVDMVNVQEFTEDVPVVNRKNRLIVA